MAQELSEGGEVAAQQCLEEWLQRQLNPPKEPWIFGGPKEFPEEESNGEHSEVSFGRKRLSKIYIYIYIEKEWENMLR